MRINIFKTLLVSLFLSVSFLGYASDTEKGGDEEFNASELIFHHIGDTHDFHVAGDFSRCGFRAVPFHTAPADQLA